MRLGASQANVQSDYPVGAEVGARYELVGPDGSRAVINDRTDPDFVGWLTDLPSGFDGPDVRESADVIPDGDGGVHGNFYFGRRPWTLSGIIDPTPDPVRDTVETLVQAAVNLIKNPAGRVASGASAIDAGTTISYSTTGGPSDIPASGYIIATASAAPTSYVGVQSDNPVPLNGANALFIAGYYYSVATARRAALSISWVDQAGSIIASSLGGTKDLGATVVGAWSRFTYAAPAPAGAVSAYVYWTALAAAGNVAVGEVHRFSGRQAIPGNVPDPGYFDGGTAPAGAPLRTAWTGAADASTSALYNVTRALMETAQVANRRMEKLKRATKALRADATLNWTPAGGLPVRLRSRRQAIRFGARRPKTFLVSMVSAERRILGQAVKNAAGAGAASLTARNDGSANASPIITLLGAWTAPVLTNSLTGETIRLTANGGLTAIAGDVTVIDVAAKTITKNGANIYGTLAFPASAWWELAPGDNVLTATGVGAGGTWSVDWRDAWE